MQSILNSTGKIFDYKIGLAGGIVMGVIVYLINYYASSDIPGAFTAALKQGVYTFFFGGFIMKLCEIIALNVKPGNLGLILAMLIPSFISLALTFGLHNLKGTPRPVESTIPTAVFVIPSTFVWAFLKQKKLKKNSTKNIES